MSLLFALLFYSSVNLGFKPSFNSQVNKDLLFNTCFKWVSTKYSNDIYNNASVYNLNPSSSNGMNSHALSDLILTTENFQQPVANDFPILSDSTGEEGLLDSTLITEDSLAVFEDSLESLIEEKEAEKDSLPVNLDSLRIYEMGLDSTNRLKYFHYTREDKPYIELDEKQESKFFVQPTSNFKRRIIQIDSTGKYVEIKELIASQETKIKLRMPLEDYIGMKIALRERSSWEEIGSEYKLKDTKVGLGELITSLTDFEIPLPSVGVLSIFGEPKISLKIGGNVTIHGAWRNETTEGVTANRLGNTRNEPDFKQTVQINVNGTIGDKLNINADWNTERTFEYENQLKLKYTGYDDEIIQSIEAGNVSMQTSSLIGGAEALFGIKALFKLGPFSLTTIASQKKGETKEVSVEGGSTAQEYDVRAYDYSTNHYFLDTVYASRNPELNLFEEYYSNVTPSVNNTYLVTEIEVWKSINIISLDKSKERIANCYINLPPIGPGGVYPDTLRDDIEDLVPGQNATGRFLLLSPGVDYTLHAETGFITFKTALNEQEIIAVAFRQENLPGGTQDDVVYGEFLNTAGSDTSRRLVLKLVKPQNLQPEGDYEQAWSLQLKNIYPTGSRNIKKEGFEFKIKYENVGQDPTDEVATANGNIRLLEAFGLDQQSEGGSSKPDNVFDWRTGLTVYPETGEIIFPTLEPFGRDIPPGLDSLKYQSVYDLTKTFARQDKAPDKWLMNGKSTGDVTSTYQLGFNVVENSVKVVLNGRELAAGTDYTVDYNIGQLTIRNEAALVPGADLKVTYEQNDLFQLASKTLLGARGLYEFSDKTHLGFTVMNLNQQTLSDKVRIGEEPLSNTIYGADFKTSAELPFLTKALDYVISTREMSNFTFSGEYAYMSPDPNTKKSTITSDEGKSIAYIDDFEGAKRIIPVGVGYTGWKDTSPPEDLPLLPGISHQERLSYKAKSFWFSITPSDVTVEQIYGDRKQVAREDQQVTVMDYVFMPDTPGTYNWNPELGNPALTWGGMQRVLSSTANNLIEQNVEFIEFWMKIVGAPENASLYLDMGLISEDVIPNNFLNNEDTNNNDLLDEGEDTGIDEIFDGEERTQSGSTKSDPSGDNFNFVQRSPPIRDDYFGINGTQGNSALTDVGLLPDTEDLNRNGYLDQVNSFFRYKIPLDTNSVTNPFISGGGQGDGTWYLYRIPIKDTSAIVGNPSFANVETIRLFTHGTDSLIHFRITEFNLVGSQWQKLVADDTVLSISVVSLEENLNYTSPPGVVQEKDRTRPDENILRNEQSLNLILNQLPVGESREAIKYLFRPLDVFNYKEIKLFIHGDDNYESPASVSYIDTITGEHAAEVFFRFGTDTNHYYEYRQPVEAGWNNISIIFDQLTAVKQAGIDTSTGIITVPVEGRPGHFYRVRGNPTLTSVKFLSVGIFNLNDNVSSIPVSGEVWINELRVVGADDSEGWAYSFATSLKFADLLTVNFNMSERNPFFHRLADRFGSRIETRNWSVSSDLDVLKLLPFNMRESNLKINYSHTESLGKPLYIPGTDVLVEEAVEQLKNLPDSLAGEQPQTPEQFLIETQTLNVSNTISASNIKLVVPSDAWYINDSWNALSFGFNYNNTFSRSPTIEESFNWVWNANANYNVSLSPDLYIKLADLPLIGAIFQLFKDYKDAKVYFTPQNFAAVITAKRNRNSNRTRPRNNNLTNESIARDFTTSRGFNFAWRLTEGGLINLTASYNVTINSSLAYLLEDADGNDRTETDIWNDIFGGATFGRDYRYSQSFDIRSSPKLPALWDINRYFTLSATYAVQYQWNYDLRQEVLGRSAGYSRRFSAGMVLRWKPLTEPLFTSSDDNTGQDNNENKNILGEEDSLGTVVSTTQKKSTLTRALLFLRAAVKAVLFDWENFNINFSHDNSLSKSGIKSYGTGFANFWGFSQNPDNGPSRAFQLGLSSDVGPRAFAENTNLSDVFSEKNTIDVKTARPLWEGAKLDINWNVNWSMNKTTTLRADEFGTISITNVNSSGSLTRSFLALPSGLLPFVDTGIKKVHSLYNPNSEDPRKSLSDAFIEGFESFPLLSSIPAFSSVSNFIPRPNWRISWDGLEKILFLKSLADRISLDHAYTSNYTEGWKLSVDGNQEIQTQRIEYGFSPLVGLNITFGQLWGGNLTGNIKFSSRNSYDLGLSTTNITETVSNDIGFTAGYSKSGFELPLFGVSLKNDIEFLLSYTSTRNSTIRFEMNNFTEDGIPQDGTTRTTIEPRIKYTISSKVSLSIFYKRSTVEPEGAARIPPTTTNEAGLDVNIVIQ